MNYQQSLEYLKKASARGARLGLERMEELLGRLGSPQNQVKTIHIAGTNGKGSVGVMLANILQKAGFKTGHFATPAMTSVNDMFRIENQVVSDTLFAETLSEVSAHAEQMTDAPTEFELLAAAAFTMFARQNCQISVIECCMGGDTDCTNMISTPLLSIITNIQKDHCAWLGSSLAEIASHKAGIIKKGCPVLTGASGEAELVIADKAKLLDAELFYPDADLQDVSGSLDGLDFSCQEFGKLHLSLCGLYQKENVRLVLTAVRILRQHGISIPDSAVQTGLAECHWNGRFELLRKQNPAVIFDGAHNPDGMKQTVSSIRHYLDGKPKIFIMGVMKDKDYPQMTTMLSPLGETFFTVRPDNPRALDPEILAKSFRKNGAPAQACASVQEALQNAFRYAETFPEVYIFGLGSLYLYQEFSQALKNS